MKKDILALVEKENISEKGANRGSHATPNLKKKISPSIDLLIGIICFLKHINLFIF